MSLAEMLMGEVLDDKLVDSLEDRFEDILSEYLILSLADVRILGAIFAVYSFVMIILSNVDTYFVMPSLFILIALGLLSLFYRLAGTRPVAVWASVVPVHPHIHPYGIVLRLQAPGVHGQSAR